MSVVDSDYDELKQYNLAEIHDPTPKLETKTSSGAPAKMEDEDDNSRSDVAAHGAGMQDDVLGVDNSQEDKASLDSHKAAEDAHLTAG